MRVLFRYEYSTKKRLAINNRLIANLYLYNLQFMQTHLRLGARGRRRNRPRDIDWRDGEPVSGAGVHVAHYIIPDVAGDLRRGRVDIGFVQRPAHERSRNSFGLGRM